MASATEIANLALGHLGSGKEIADIDTENSTEARAARRFFKDARKESFRDMRPDFATRKHVALTLKATDPNAAWTYSYVYPTDALCIVSLWSGSRNDRLTTQIPFEIAYESSGTVIYTDLVDALVNYVIDVPNYERYPFDFKMALSYKLAWFMAPLIGVGDRFKNANRVGQLYEKFMDKSLANDANEGQRDVPPDSELVTIRT